MNSKDRCNSTFQGVGVGGEGGGAWVTPYILYGTNVSLEEPPFLGYLYISRS